MLYHIGNLCRPARSPRRQLASWWIVMTGPQVPPRPFSTAKRHTPVRSPSDRRSKQRQNVIKDRRAKVEPYSFSPLYVPCSSDCPLHAQLYWLDPQQAEAIPATPATPPANRSKTSDVLQSWKEISAYIKRSVRTCQRWERQAELPVHRPHPTRRSPVFSLPTELDLWMKQQRTRNQASRPGSPSGGAAKHAVA
jgi:hypothetical protein